MSNRRKLFIDRSTKGLLISDRKGGAYVLPSFRKYETVTFEVYIVEPSPTQIGAYDRLDVDNISLRMAMHSAWDTATPFAEQTSWSKDSTENFLYGDFSLNTAGANSHIGSASSVTAYFEIEMMEGSGREKIYSTAVTMVQAVAQPTTTAPTPITEYMTRNEALSSFPRFSMAAGESITLKSAGSLYTCTLWLDDAGVLHTDVLPV